MLGPELIPEVAYSTFYLLVVGHDVVYKDVLISVMKVAFKYCRILPIIPYLSKML